MNPPAEALRRSAQRAEERGYDSVWWGDHLMGWHAQAVWEQSEIAQRVPNPHCLFDTMTSMASVAVQTERVTLGTAVTDTVRRHPAVLAHEFLTLDHLSQGRVILGVGAGEAENIEPYGLDYARPVARFEEALKIVRLLWEHDEPVDFDGEFWTLRDAVLGLPPYGEPGAPRRYPPIWSGAHGPRMLGITGRLCDGWIPTYRGSVDDWAASLATIRASAQQAGRDPQALVPGLAPVLVVDEDPDVVEQLLSAPLLRAWQLILPSSSFEALGHRHPLGDDFYGLRDYVPTRLSDSEAVRAADAVSPDVVRAHTLCGTPDEILDELSAYMDAGLRHVVLWNLTPMADVSKVRSSFGLVDEIAAELRARSAASDPPTAH